MRRSFLRNSFFSALMMLSWFSSSGQKVNSHTVYWTRFQSQLNFTPKIYWTNEFDNRRFIAPDVQNQFIFHSRAHYKIKRWDYAAGVSVSWAYSASPDSPIKHATLELRPVIEASYEIPLKNWTFTQRLRIDNRFIEEDRFSSVFDGSTHVMRLRYRAQGRIALVKDEEGAAKVVAKVADEIMFNHRENLFDQNRIYGTLEFNASRTWTIEAGYIHIYQQRFGREDFLERHVLRFSLQHKLFFY